MSRRLLALSTVLFVALLLPSRPVAQSKPTLKPADYDQFETVAPAAGRGGLSPDGKWFAYTVTKVGGDSELRITQVGGTVVEDRAVCLGRELFGELRMDRVQHRRLGGGAGAADRGATAGAAQARDSQTLERRPRPSSTASSRSRSIARVSRLR